MDQTSLLKACRTTHKLNWQWEILQLRYQPSLSWLNWYIRTTPLHVKYNNIYMLLGGADVIGYV